MSAINIQRAIENIRSKTTIFTPIVEAIVNSIQAIHAIKNQNGLIAINISRVKQDSIEGIESTSSKISSISITDNGIGFDENHRDSFDTLYSDLKASEGGKGFGRLTYLKYFNTVRYRSIFKDEDGLKERSFTMGKHKNFITDELIEVSNQQDTGTTVFLEELKQSNLLNCSSKIIARTIVELLLPYFVAEEYKCPLIVLKDEIEQEEITLNDYLNSSDAVITKIAIQNDTFTIKNFDTEKQFKVMLFKFIYPGNKVSKISLVGHKREVEATPLYKYIPEFENEFYEPPSSKYPSGRNYIIKAYVFSEYLDANVSIERGGFIFKKEKSESQDFISEITQHEIETATSDLIKPIFNEELSSRLERKIEAINNYVEDYAPWHKETLKYINLNSFPSNPSAEVIEAKLHEEKYKNEKRIRSQVNQILTKDREPEDEETNRKLADAISESSKSELVHYVALRKNLLDLLGKSLEYRDDGKYHTEGTVHDIIFPRRTDTDTISYKNHNLWILDERLSFTEYVTSDIPINGGNTERSDILVYGKRVAMRGENELSNPVTIFEFKRPGRDDFTNPSSHEDPIAQIIRYTLSIRNGDFKTPTGRDMLINEKTPFYGYIICDLTKKVKNWLRLEKSYTEMPDGLGWFKHESGPNIYIEVLSWDKVYKDATMRNRIFFHKLGIS